MNTKRIHRKVWLAWGRWWAFQLQLQPTISLGIRLELARPMLDLYIGPMTFALGRHPILTDESKRHMDSSRGFIFSMDEVL
jgi:hypothetical protein